LDLLRKTAAAQGGAPGGNGVAITDARQSGNTPTGSHLGNG
jgi:hypothetical protein